MNNGVVSADSQPAYPVYSQYSQPASISSNNQDNPTSVFPSLESVQPMAPTPDNSSVTPAFPVYTPGVAPVYVPQPIPVAAPGQSGEQILQAPDPQFFAPVMTPNVNSPYPLPQQPKGDTLTVLVEYNKHENKEKSAMIGVGVGAAAMLFTGGLALPLIAGAITYNAIKDNNKARYAAYPNSYVYELRSAVAADLDVKPELVLLQRKGVIFDDNEQLQKYIKNKKKFTVEISILETPVAGSNYYAPNGSIYPAPVTVSLVKGKKRH